MSDMERNKGKLIYAGVDTEDFTEDDYDTYTENGFVNIDGEIYEVQWNVKHDTDYSGFAEVTLNSDGSIDFHTYHYNGGAHWTELIEEGLRVGK